MNKKISDYEDDIIWIPNILNIKCKYCKTKDNIVHGTIPKSNKYFSDRYKGLNCMLCENSIEHKLKDGKLYCNNILNNTL